jgi:hypothetical protein
VSGAEGDGLLLPLRAPLADAQPVAPALTEPVPLRLAVEDGVGDGEPPSVGDDVALPLSDAPEDSETLSVAVAEGEPPLAVALARALGDAPSDALTDALAPPLAVAAPECVTVADCDTVAVPLTVKLGVPLPDTVGAPLEEPVGESLLRGGDALVDAHTVGAPLPVADADHVHCAEFVSVGKEEPLGLAEADVVAELDTDGEGLGWPPAAASNSNKRRLRSAIRGGVAGFITPRGGALPWRR